MTTKARAAEKDTAADKTEPGAAERAAADADRNAISAQRTDELHQADQTVRGGGPNPHAGTTEFPKALSREDQERNAEAARKATAVNMTGSPEGVATVLPAVGGVTNMALTPAELQAQLDDGAVDERGRLVGTYLDVEQARIQHERRLAVENAGSLDGEDASLRRAAAERVRNLAASPATPASDMGKPASEQALVNTDKLTGPDTSKANTREHRASEAARNESSAGTTR